MIRKTIFREIRGSLGRYLAILAIIALGTGFFAGLRVCKPSMVTAANEYLQKQSMFDYRLVSTLGYQAQDVDAVAALSGVETAAGSISMDVLVRSEAESQSLHDDSDIVMMAELLTPGINEPELKEGRMPQAADECLADAYNYNSDAIGTTIQISQDNDQDTLDALSRREYTIVGLATSPLFLNFERGSSSLGSGVVAAFFYLLPSGFDCDYFTEIYLTLDSTDGLFIYSDQYNDAADAMESPVTAAAETAAQNRYDRIVGDAERELADAQKEYDDALDEFETSRGDAEGELADAWQELEDARLKISDGEKEIADGWAELRDETAKAEKELEDAQQELDDGLVKLQDGEKEYADGLAEFENAKAEYESGKAEYEDGLKKYNEGLAEYEDGLQKYKDAKKQLDSADMTLAGAGGTLQSYEEQYQQMLALYGAVSTMAAGAGTDAGTYIQGLKMQVAAADAGDPAAIAAVGAMDAALQGAGFGGTRELTAAWDMAEAGIAAAGYGTELSDVSLAAMRAALDAGSKQFSDGLWELTKAQEKLKEAKKELDDAKLELDDAWQELEDARLELADGEAKLADAGAELNSARAELDNSWAEYYNGLDELADGQETLAAETADAKRKLYNAQAELEDGKAEYEDGLAEYYDARAEADSEFADAEKELADAEKKLADARVEIDDIQAPTVFTLSREANTGYVCLKSDSEIVHGISTVFPMFFFIVAALVCITTMTRMVEEQRTQIGVMKALGYGPGLIALKYLFYSGSASFIGCVAGFFIGSFAIPKVIWAAYKIMYNFGEISFYFDLPLALICIFSYLVCAMAATWLSCRGELRQVPAELIRPKAPKAGKRVLLERIPFIWNHMGFLSKVSFRNIFRYRQRLIMMIVGICGCTALLLTGYGIRDSITNVVYYQYDEITKYDCVVSTAEAHDDQWLQELAAAGDGSVENIMLVAETSMDMDVGDKVKTVTMVVPEGDISPFVDLHKDGKPVEFPGLGQAVISTSVAEHFGLSAGDSFSARDPDMKELRLTVSGVCENYVYNYIFVSPETCVQELGEAPEMKDAFVNFTEGSDPNAAAAKLLGYDGVTSAVVSQDFKERITSMMSSMDYIVWLVIFCAAGLAFIVLYNLTNISMTERIREIATIKVLGFYPFQSAVYVFRENLVLTIVGALCGLGVGVWLHRFVMSKIKIDMVFFDARIVWKSYLIAVLFTIAFALIVDFVMYFKLRRVNMAEALKSIE